MKKEKWEEEIEEYGDLHGECCACMSEDPDECDCDEMKQIKQFIRKEKEKSKQEETERWIELAKAHRKHCTPEGNKDITRMMGNKNR
jgi:hypothetical protein